MLSDHSRFLHDHFPISPTSTRQIPDHFLIAFWALAYSLLNFFDSQKLSCRKSDRCRPPRSFARPVPDRSIRLDEISSLNPALLPWMQEVEKLRVQLEESTRKLHELVSINQKLDADCCQLITEKRVLEMRLDAVEDLSPSNNNNSLDAKVLRSLRIKI